MHIRQPAGLPSAVRVVNPASAVVDGHHATDGFDESGEQFQQRGKQHRRDQRRETALGGERPMVDHIAGACGHDQCQSLDDEREQQAQTDGGHVPAEEPGQDGDGSAARPYGNGCAAVVCRLRNQHRARTVGREFAGRIGMAPVRRVSDAPCSINGTRWRRHDLMLAVRAREGRSRRACGHARAWTPW